MSETKDIALVLHTTDYRGDHARDIQLVIRVPMDATVSYLLNIVEKYSGQHRAVLEIKPEAPRGTG